MYERQIEARRQRETFESEMAVVTSYHKAMSETAKADDRVEAKRREQEVSAANFEMRREQNFIEEDKALYRQEALKEQEERIAAEIHRRKVRG